MTAPVNPNPEKPAPAAPQEQEKWTEETLEDVLRTFEGQPTWPEVWQKLKALHNASIDRLTARENQELRAWREQFRVFGSKPAEVAKEINEMYGREVREVQRLRKQLEPVFGKPEADVNADHATRQKIPLTDFRFARDVVNGIVTAYQDYVRLLNNEIGDLVFLAVSHGWKSKRVEDGKLCRQRIDSAVSLWQTEVDWHEGRALDSLDSQRAPSVPDGTENQPVAPVFPKPAAATPAMEEQK